MGYVLKKYVKPREKMYVCPRCGSHRVEQKWDAGDFKFLCINCYWHGQTPIIQDKPKSRNTATMWRTVKYEDIIKNLLRGQSILEQLEAFGVPQSKDYTNGRLRAIKNKILRVYNCYVEVTGIPCEDPDLVKIKVTDDVRELVTAAIDEETKIRNASRSPVMFSK